MWLQLMLLAVLSIALFCGTLELMSHCYLKLLERLFTYTSKQVQLVQQRQQIRCTKPKQKPKSKRKPKQSQPVWSTKPRWKALNASMEQCCGLIADGLRLVLEDKVTTRFAAAEPPAGEWNLLTRNLRIDRNELNVVLLLMWTLSIVLRYGLLVPVRIVGCSCCLMLIMLLTAALGQLPEWSFKQRLVRRVMRLCFRLTNCFIPVLRRVHNEQHRPRRGISVCNHTTPLDVLVLMCDVHYSLTGQRHNGVLGTLQRALARASSHYWFDRQTPQEREKLTSMLRMHATQAGMSPILLFPEGTCINNTAVMQFQKGGFAISNVIHPIAVRYDRRFGDAFWDSTRCSALRYLIMVISSWTLLCDVWYMPPMRRHLAENPIEFANRVKAAIAAQAGIVDLPWDGNLKRRNSVRDWQ